MANLHLKLLNHVEVLFERFCIDTGDGVKKVGTGSRFSLDLDLRYLKL